MRITLVTDAWRPQVNGVVTTLEYMVASLHNGGHQVQVIEPSQFSCWRLPGYREIGVAVTPWQLPALLEQSAPDTLHIATEGPLGIAARNFCKKRGWSFTTSLHTKFPEYVHARTGLPTDFGYRFLRWFHGPASTTLVTTQSMVSHLQAKGLQSLKEWGRGVDCDAFTPQDGCKTRQRARPKLLYVGRVAIEKNIEAFLQLSIDAEKIVVGDGPMRQQLQLSYPDVQWMGYKRGAELASFYADADVFVFPSLTDTFGIVMLEAMACGTPVAAYPVTGPIDVVASGVNGALDDDLSAAVNAALQVDRQACRDFALQRSWQAVADIFQKSLVPASPSQQKPEPTKLAI